MSSAEVPTEESVDIPVTPVVLREELRPPNYGSKYSERASRSFYAKYIEYKRQVELANAGGAVRYQVVSMAQLVPTPLHRAFARVFYDKSTITPLQLAAAIKKHAGHAAGAEVELTEASAAVATAVRMDQKGKTMLDKVEPIRGNLETLFAENPNVEMLFRTSEGKFRPGPAEVITRAMVEGLAPAEFQQIVKVKLQYASNWKSDPNLVMDTVVAEAKAWRQIEMYSKLSSSSPQSSRSRNRGSKSAGGAPTNKECFMCGQVGHYAR